MISEPGIRLDPSPLYCRLTACVYLFTGYVVYQTSIPWPGKCFIALLLLWQLHLIMKYKKPHPELHSIVFKQDQWVLRMNKNIIFLDVRLILDTGYFLLLLFSSESGIKKHVLVFHDQLNPGLRQQLHRLIRSLQAKK